MTRFDKGDRQYHRISGCHPYKIQTRTEGCYIHFQLVTTIPCFPLKLSEPTLRNNRS